APKMTVAGLRDLVFDEGTGRIFAAVAGNPGSVVPIDPVARTLGTAIPVGIDPVKLARSDDGRYLYVALDGEPAVQRIPIGSAAADLKFALGSDSFFGPYYVEDMQVLPGNAHAIAASLMNKGISPRHAGVAIYDDGVVRPSM